MQTAPGPDATKHVVTNPDWAQRPSGEDVARFYPPAAERQGVEGAATVSCQVSREGNLRDCRIQSETPAGAGFGEAVVNLAQTAFKMRPMTVDGQPVDGGTVRIPVHFMLPPPPPRSLPRTHPDPAAESPAVIIAAVVALALMSLAALWLLGRRRASPGRQPGAGPYRAAPEPPSGRFAALYRAFDNRFEEDRGGYILRAKPGASGYRVSAAERDAMVTDYRRGVLWLFAGLVAAILALCAGLTVVFESQGRQTPTWAIWLGVLMFGVAFTAGFTWLSGAPFRRLEGRVQIDQGGARDGASRAALDALARGPLRTDLLTIGSRSLLGSLRRSGPSAPDMSTRAEGAAIVFIALSGLALLWTMWTSWPSFSVPIQALVPPLVLAMAARAPGRMSLAMDDQTDGRTKLGYGLLTAMGGLGLTAYRDYHELILDGALIGPAMAAMLIGALIAFLCSRIDPGQTSDGLMLLFVGVGGAVWTAALLLEVNGHLHQRYRETPVEVADKQTRHLKGGDVYELWLRATHDAPAGPMEVRRPLFDRTPVGARVCVIRATGALNISWWQVSECRQQP